MEDHNQDITSMITRSAGVWVAKSIALAAEFRLADHLGDSSNTIEELAELSGTHAPSLYRLMRALASIGIFKERSPQRFEQTAMSKLIRCESRDSIAGLARLYASSLYLRIWDGANHALTTGEPVFSNLYSEDRWKYYSDHPCEAQLFEDAMSDWSYLLHREAIKDFDFSQHATIVDVGGGHGQLLGGILHRQTRAKGILVEQQRVVAKAADKLASLGVLERTQLISGDFLRSVPSGGDLYILAHVLVDWDDDAARRILLNCREVMKCGTKLLILEQVLAHERDASFSRFLDVHIMLMSAGRLRTIEEFVQLLQSTGFKLDRRVDSDSFMSRIEASAD